MNQIRPVNIISLKDSTIVQKIPPSYITMRYLTCECGETFFTEDDLNIHFFKTQHDTITRDISTYQCNLCTKVLDTEKCVLQHHAMVHLASLTERRRMKLKSYMSGNNECPICGKVLKAKSSLYIHMKCTHGEKSYKCDYCGRCFALKNNLRSHINSHTGERPYQCTKCPMKFATGSNLIRHLNIHAGKKPHKCEMCSNCYISKSELKIHVNTVHLKIQAPYKRKPRGTGRPRMTITNYHTFV